jgi:predicted secreted protein
LTEQDKNKTLTISVGDSFVIRFNENPSTGYVWEIDGQTELFVLQSSDYVTDTPSIRRVKFWFLGAVKEALLLWHKKSGMTPLKLKHWRAWEDDASIVDTFNIPVQIKTK